MKPVLAPASQDALPVPLEPAPLHPEIIPVLIIGAGPAGYTAGIYTARGGLKTFIVQGQEPGGQLMGTTHVENYPGFSNPIMGPQLMKEMATQAQAMGVQCIYDSIKAVKWDEYPFISYGQKATYQAHSIIIATGAQAKWLGCAGEEELRGYGVSSCATCDGFFFRGQEVAVVGGGNTAVEEALFLTQHATKVWLIHRRDSLRAEKVLQERLFANPKVSILWDHVVDRLEGKLTLPKSLTGVHLRHVTTGQEKLLPVQGLFVAIGHAPATQPFRGWIDCDEQGYILGSPEAMTTSRPGIFAAGDVRDAVYRQAVTAAAQGCMAALDIQRAFQLGSFV